MIWACDFLSRMRGLLFRPAGRERIVIVPCSDVHTFGMREHLDIAFFDKSGRAIAVYTDVSPGRRLKHKRAAFVVEGFSRFREGRGFAVGDIFVAD